MEEIDGNAFTRGLLRESLNCHSISQEYKKRVSFDRGKRANLVFADCCWDEEFIKREIDLLRHNKNLLEGNKVIERGSGKDCKNLE